MKSKPTAKIPITVCQVLELVDSKLEDCKKSDKELPPTAREGMIGIYDCFETVRENLEVLKIKVKKSVGNKKNIITITEAAANLTAAAAKLTLASGIAAATDVFDQTANEKLPDKSKHEDEAD